MGLLKKYIRFDPKGKLILTSFGDSMRPLLMPQDVVEIQRARFSKIAVNDIVLAKKKDLFIHRVIYKGPSYLITKGDNNLKSDGRIYPRQIIGKVIAVKKNGKFISFTHFYLIQSAIYFRELVKLNQALTLAKIEFVYLKGLPLHLWIEGTHPKRLYADCDILIAKKASGKVHKILQKLGFKKLSTSLSHTHERLKNKESETTYVKSRAVMPMILDVHYEAVFLMTQVGRLDVLYPQKLIDELTSDFLDRKRNVLVSSYSFPILSQPHLVLYLLLHLFHHNFKGIYRYELLDKVIRKERDKKYFISLFSLFEKFKLSHFVSPAIYNLRKYFQTFLPGQKYSSRINPFDDESRLEAGINRFKYIFFLSEEPIWKKIFVFFNPSVLFSILWSLKRKTRVIIKR